MGLGFRVTVITQLLRCPLNVNLRDYNGMIMRQNVKGSLLYEGRLDPASRTKQQPRLQSPVAIDEHSAGPNESLYVTTYIYPSCKLTVTVLCPGLRLQRLMISSTTPPFSNWGLGPGLSGPFEPLTLKP